MNQQDELLLSGNIYFRVYNAGTGQWSTGWEKAEVDKLEIQTPSETVRRVSNGKGTYGQAVGGVTVAQPTTFNITFAAASIEMMRMKLAGEVEDIAIGAGSIDATVPVVVGKWCDVGVRNIATAAFAVKNAAGTTTYVMGTDYEVNYLTGMILPLEGGAIVAGNVKVTGTHNAISGRRVKGAKRYRNVFEFKLDGENLTNEKPVFLHAYRAVATSDSAHDFFTKGLSTVPLSGELEVPDGKSEPFVLEYLDV